MNNVNDVALSQVNILGSTMACREAGDSEAPVVLFLHGNPTSSYVWRNVLPHVAHGGALRRTGFDRVRSIRKTRHRMPGSRSCPIPRCVS